MKRRSFVKKIGGAMPIALFGSNSLVNFSKSPYRHITILHTNDTHSHIDPFGSDHHRNANKGGIARRAELISKIRSENPNTLLMDAGDIFQGTHYFNYYKGELEFRLMSSLKYDVATLGNHDFDNGIEGLFKQLPHAKFDFVSANYDFKNTVLDTYIKPYKVIVKGGIRIGVFGLGIELEGLVNKKNFKETKYLDPIEIAKDISKELKENEKCDLIICLSHLGYFYKNNPDTISDLNLAKATKDIDLIIGGHTHTFLDKPTIMKNSVDKNILVNQVGCYGLYLGRIDFYFDKNNINSNHKENTIIVG
tara:strand:+ start:228 stop:1148 length:921 start_codon:yes stop_codon:yes gene_type:complete